MKTSHPGKDPLERLAFPVSALLIALAAVVGFAPNSVAVIDAAFFRMSWFLPGLGIESFVVAAHVQQLALIVPILMLDFKRYGRPHAVTLSGIMLLLAFTAVIAILWPQAA